MHNDGLFILVHVAFNFLHVDNADATLTSTACSHVLVQNTTARWLVECYSGALPRLATVVSDTVLWAVSPRPRTVNSAWTWHDCVHTPQTNWKTYYYWHPEATQRQSFFFVFFHPLNGFHKRNVTELCKWEQKTVLWNSHSTGSYKKKKRKKEKSERSSCLRLNSSIFIPGIGSTVWTQTQNNNRTEFHFKHQRCTKLSGSVVLFEVFRHSPCVNPFVSLCTFFLNFYATFFFY